MSSLHAAGLPADKLCIVANDAEPLDFAQVDLCFADGRWKGWYTRLPARLAQGALDHLSHRVTRFPEQLSVHLYRIAVAWQLKRGEALYGALLDLFIVLDRRGFALRQRLLNKLTPCLTDAQRQALRQGLLFGISAVERLPGSYSSRFNPGLVADCTVVVRTEQTIDARFDELEEARDLIDSGFLEEARLILEEAVLRRPQHEGLNRELLVLYRHTRNAQALHATRARLGRVKPALSQEWDALADSLSAGDRLVG